MKCPFCNYEDTKVINSRAMEDGSVIKRRRQCDSCGERFTTYEKIETIPLIVIKNNNTREEFDKNKLIKGIVSSCSKRPVTMEQIEKIANEIENSIKNSMNKEIQSKQIGEMAMAKLKDLDEVSYVRFASVYRKFKDIDSFMDELNILAKEKKK